MRSTLLALAALAIAAPAVAADQATLASPKRDEPRQEWPKQDWYLLDVPFSTGLPRVRDVHATGWTPPGVLESGRTTAYYSDAGRVGRTWVAVDIASIRPTGKQVEVRYVQWSDQEAGVIEMTSRIDCAKTGETIIQARDIGEDFAPGQAVKLTLKRIDPTAMAVATQVCRMPGSDRVSARSLPEIVAGRRRAG